MHLIQKQRELDGFLAKIAGAPAIAIDTEFCREVTYRPRLALLQLAAGRDAIALIDPFAVSTLAPVFDLLRDPVVRKVMHASSQDMEIFVDRMGSAPANVYDTQVAAAFLGYGTSVGLAKLVERELGIEIDKSQTYTDWMQRPLSDAQREYAANDVRYLLDLAAHLETALDERGRRAWVAPVQQGLSDVSRYVADPRRAYLRVKRAWTLAPAELAVLRELAAWREDEAERQDKPRETIMPDERLVALALAQPRSDHALSQMRVIGRGTRGQEHAILAAIARGQAAREVPSEEAAELRPVTPDVQVVLDVLLAVLRERAHAEGIAASYLATPLEMRRALEAVREGRAMPPLPLFASWRREVAGGAIEGLLNGSVRVGTPGGRVVLAERSA